MFARCRLDIESKRRFELSSAFAERRRGLVCIQELLAVLSGNESCKEESSVENAMENARRVVYKMYPDFDELCKKMGLYDSKSDEEGNRGVDKGVILCDHVSDGCPECDP